MVEYNNAVFHVCRQISMDKLSETGQIIRVTRIGLWLNSLLFVLKFAVGVIAGSTALVADAIHSISDFLSDIVVLLGVRLSSRPVDRDHDYGHGKLETIAALIVAGLLAGVGIYIICQSSVFIFDGETSSPGIAVLIVAVVSIASKEWLFRITRRVGKRLRSPSLQVNAWHHRSDAFSSVAVLIGAVAGIAGWGHADHAAAIAVGAMIVWVGVKAVLRYVFELSEGSVDADERDSIIRAIQSVKGVRSWHNLRTRLVGRAVFMDVTVVVNPNISVDQGHEICCEVERAIAGAATRSTNILVHCEPDRDSTKSYRGDHER